MKEDNNSVSYIKGPDTHLEVDSHEQLCLPISLFIKAAVSALSGSKLNSTRKKPPNKGNSN